MGACQYIHALFAGFVRMRLDIGEEVRHLLCFVDDRSVRIGTLEPSGIFRGEQSHIGIFQRDILVLWQRMTQQRGFAGLSGAGQGDDWIILQKLQ